MKLNAKEIIKPALTLVTICFVVTLCLAITNAVTKTAIQNQKEKDTLASRQVALAAADSFTKKTDTCYVGTKGGQTVGWVFTTKTGSYGGDIEVMTGIGKNGKITGVVLTSTNDTPGLGLNAKNESFRNQYKQDAPQNGFEVIKGSKAGKGQISALTGATITSKAVTKAVNEAVAEYQKVKGGD